MSNTIEKVMGKGVLLSLRMPVDASSKPKGFAFANFEDEESKQVAMRKLKNYEFMGRLLRAEDGDAPKRTKESAVAPPRQQQEPRPRASAGDSLEEFMSFGYSGEEESSRGERAGAGSRGEGSPRVDATLYFGNLAYAVDEAVLRDAVERVVGRGSVVSARIATDIETGRKKGFGYVDFANQDDAEKVCLFVPSLTVLVSDCADALLYAGARRDERNERQGEASQGGRRDSEAVLEAVCWCK